jgi:VCPO second helical-bundle domain
VPELVDSSLCSNLGLFGLRFEAFAHVYLGTYRQDSDTITFRFDDASTWDQGWSCLSDSRPTRGLCPFATGTLNGDLLEVRYGDSMQHSDFEKPVDSKNHYDYWRPVTAIQTGDTDGNPDTVGDPTWTPLRPTPPNQDYASGHSIEGGAGAEVLKQFFGTDEIGFRDCSASLPAGSTCGDATPVFRSYTSFSQAAVENAHSRIFIGFHFRKSVEEGTEYGRKIGKRAANLYLRPVH